ncbi:MULTISPECIES: toxin glutamine deamidase domain-containing protein [unclassified Streptomyces]|uniref:toxin glutamine deamidase domain-containing protein n=1 Tax=unclassified Streptomyces TaxID=2593676 RepID=UPI00225B8142|nr:toxin glutamine deamidase domain-containing protein [Streptomyces sp. NBC_01264]MCX4784117.1 toxin glutamine deamidase domain-containing protein [Streptomyces sp. NBC_01264]
MRRAKYATNTSAAAKNYRQALDDGEVDHGGAAWRAHQRAQSSADRARAAAEEGDHEGAERAALDAKNAMNHAARLARSRTQSAAARAKEERRDSKGVDQALHAANPKYQPHVRAYSHNCTHVAQTYELRRRGLDVEAAPDTTGGRSVLEYSEPWGGVEKFTFCDTNARDVGRSEVERAFAEPGSRGLVRVRWKNGGGHAFSVENVGGKVRFIDAQPNPPVTDASHYFSLAESSGFIRLDDKPTPSRKALSRFIVD